MSILYFPNVEDIKEWIAVVRDSGFPTEYLPAMDDVWAIIMLKNFDLTAMHPDSAIVERSAARIFYRVTKNHDLADGNKRSAILCTYLFVFLNHWKIALPPAELYVLAKSVAESKENQEMVIDRMSSIFLKSLIHIK